MPPGTGWLLAGVTDRPFWPSRQVHRSRSCEELLPSRRLTRARARALARARETQAASLWLIAATLPEERSHIVQTATSCAVGATWVFPRLTAAETASRAARPRSSVATICKQLRKGSQKRGASATKPTDAPALDAPLPTPGCFLETSAEVAPTLVPFVQALPAYGSLSTCGGMRPAREWLSHGEIGRQLGRNTVVGEKTPRKVCASKLVPRSACRRYCSSTRRLGLRRRERRGPSGAWLLGDNWFWWSIKLKQLCKLSLQIGGCMREAYFLL